MKGLLKLIPFLSALLLFGAPAAGSVPDREDNYAFRHLRSDNSSLSFNGVVAIAQDAHGFVWVGTSDGMNRYDGAGFKAYRKNELGLQSAFVVSLCADREGNLWVGTDSGATRYDYASDTFVPLLKQSNLGTVIQNKVTCIKIDSDGLVWMSVNGQGLFSYNQASGELLNYFYDGGATTLPAGITSFCIDGAGGFVFDLYGLGLFRTDRNFSETLPLEAFASLKGDFIVDIACGVRPASILCASVERGLFEINLSKGSLSTLIPAEEGMVPYKLFIDEGSYVWMPSTEGLWRYDLQSGKVRRFLSDPSDDFSLGDMRVTSVFRDSAGGLWAGTAASGVDYCGFFQNHFHRYASAGGETLRGSLPRSMCPDGRGGVWIGTETQGLLFYDSESEELSRYSRAEALPKGIFSLCHDDGTLWAGTYSGIVRLDIDSGRTRVYPQATDVSSLSDNKLYVIRKLSDGRVLVGTPLGILIYDRDADTFRPTSGLDGIFVTDILEDSAGRIWIASYAHGIFLYDIDRDVTTARWFSGAGGAREIPMNKINALMQDSSGDIWATSYSSGFFRIGEEKGEGRVFSTAMSPSISSDMVFSMLEDGRGKIWITSSNGLMAYDPKTGEIDTYTVDNGLLDNEFNISSGLRLEDGSLLLGSTNGLVRFHPADLEVNPDASPIVLADFRIESGIVTPAPQGSLLNANINECRRIVLPFRNNTFGVLVTMPLMPSPHSGGVNYILEGFDGKWKHFSWTGRPVSLAWNGVPPGRYCLRIKSGSFEHAPLTIIVRRHPLLSIPAVCVYILLLIAAVAALVWYVSVKARRSSEKASYKDKMAFFTNIIHELKTPLTLIKTPLRNILAKRDGDKDEIDEDLATISSSAEYMDKLVKEMLDFVKIEQNGYKLTYSRVDLVEKIRLLCGSFEESAKNRNLVISFLPEQESIVVHADDSAVTKVINNLLLNALKYAETNISLGARLDSGEAVLSFCNDGPLIPRVRRSEIFKPFVQFDGDNGSYSQSFGVGLALAKTIAEMHGGSLSLEDGPKTCFVLRLPLNMDIPVPEAEPGDDPGAEAVSSELPTVLVVEDNEELQKYLKRKLSSEFNVQAVASAEAAMREVRNGEVDLVVSDIALGGTSGIELCRRITSDFDNSHVVVIMLSAISSVETKLEAMESGASLYIEKPFDLEYLISSIRILLDKRRIMRAAYINDVHPDPASYNLPGSDEAFLKKLDDLIMSNLSDPSFSVDQLSEALNLSRYTLLRKIKGLLGTTPNDYIRLKRLSVAASLLKNNTTRVSEVCYSVGFNTPSYFAKCFRMRYGVLPGDYMREHSQLKENKQ